MQQPKFVFLHPLDPDSHPPCRSGSGSPFIMLIRIRNTADYIPYEKVVLPDSQHRLLGTRKYKYRIINTDYYVPRSSGTRSSTLLTMILNFVYYVPRSGGARGKSDLSQYQAYENHHY